MDARYYIDGARILFAGVAAWIGANSFGFSQSGKTVTFYPLNHGRSTISNGAFRFLLRFYKTI